MMDFLKQNKTIIGGIVVIVLAVIVYFMYFAGGSSSATLTSSDANSAVSQNLLVTLQNLHTIKLDDSIFQQPCVRLAHRLWRDHPSRERRSPRPVRAARAAPAPAREVSHSRAGIDFAMNLLQLLSDNGTLDKAAVPELEAELAKPGATVEQVLQKNGVALKDILKAKGDYYGIPTREVGDKAVPFDILRYVPEESARHYRLAPLGIAGWRARNRHHRPRQPRSARRIDLHFGKGRQAVQTVSHHRHRF